MKVDLGLPDSSEWTSPLPKGMVVARFTGKVPSAGQFKLVHAGHGYSGDFVVASDGSVTMDVVRKGFMIIFR